MTTLVPILRSANRFLRNFGNGLNRYRTKQHSVATLVTGQSFSEGGLRKNEEKASPFTAGMNPTISYANHRSMARQDIPRGTIHTFK